MQQLRRMIQIFLGHTDAGQSLDKDNANNVQTGQGPHPQAEDFGLKQDKMAVSEEKVLYIRKLEDTDLVRSFFNRIF